MIRARSRVMVHDQVRDKHRAWSDVTRPASLCIISGVTMPASLCIISLTLYTEVSKMLLQFGLINRGLRKVANLNFETGLRPACAVPRNIATCSGSYLG